MNKTLVILAHPDMSRSVANKAIAEELKNNATVEIRTIAELYPDFQIDAAAEQKALMAADNIVLQFPMQWFNVPGILKHWLDICFELGFAHGENGDKLKGKNFLISFTAGVSEDFYNEGYNLENFTDMFLHTAAYTGMNFAGAVYECGMMANPAYNQTVEDVQKRAKQQADKIIKALKI